jgi:glycosyltransferase involved in cell wall biosynthesis
VKNENLAGPREIVSRGVQSESRAVMSPNSRPMASHSVAGSPAVDSASTLPVVGLRIALFVNSITMGGVEEHVRQIATGLRARGAIVTVICPEAPQIDPLAEAVSGTGAEVVRLDLLMRMGLRSSLKRLRRLVRLLKDNRVQVLHIHLTGYSGGRWAVLAARLARVPATICTIQIAPAQPERLSIRIERRGMNLLVDQFIAVSRATRGQLIEFAALSPEKTIVIPNAVELSRYENVPRTARIEVRRQFGIPDDAPLMGSVARLDPQKGLTYLVAAMPAVVARAPTVHLLLVGDGPLRASLEEQAAALGMTDRIHFAGQQWDIPRYLAALDVFVLPSLFEGLPLSILEAMAAGLPVVATSVDGTPEATEDGVTGYLVPPADSSALATALVRLLEEPAAAVRMSAEARIRSRTFSLDALLDRLSTAYFAVLRAR